MSNGVSDQLHLKFWVKAVANLDFSLIQNLEKIRERLGLPSLPCLSLALPQAGHQTSHLHCWPLSHCKAGDLHGHTGKCGAEQCLLTLVILEFGIRNQNQAAALLTRSRRYDWIQSRVSSLMGCEVLQLSRVSTAPRPPVSGAGSDWKLGIHPWLT